MVSVTFWMFPIAVIMALMEWLKANNIIDIGAMIEEWATANPETVEGIAEFIKNTISNL